MQGKKAAAFCTFALSPARTLDKLTAALGKRGAEVLGGFAMNRRQLERNTDEFVERLLDLATSRV
jgi:hypothetical protein